MDDWIDHIRMKLMMMLSVRSDQMMAGKQATGKKADSDKYTQQCDEGGKGYTIEAK